MIIQLLKDILHELRVLNGSKSLPSSELSHITIEEAASMMNCHENSIRQMIKDGELKPFQYKKIIRIRTKVFERFLNKNTG